LITRKIFGDEYMVLSSSLCSLVAGLSWQRIVFNPRPVHLGFVVD
jgi:hypothetical protein